VDISTTPKAAEPSVKAVTDNGDTAKESNGDVEVKADALEIKDEVAGHLKPELLDVKESRVASLKRNLSFSKMKKMFSRGDNAEVETKEEGADDVKVEVTSDEAGDAKDEAEEEEASNKKEEEADKEVIAPEEEKSAAAAEGDSKVTEWKNSLFKMFSRESADNEDTTASSKKEGTEEEQEVEGAGDGLKTEEGSEQEKKAEGGESKMTNLKKRLSFKAIKSRFSKEKKEEEEKENEEGEVKEEVKTDGDDGAIKVASGDGAKSGVKTGDEEAIKVASDEEAKDIEPPTEAPPAVPVQPVAEEDANAKNAQPGESSENGALGETE